MLFRSQLKSDDSTTAAWRNFAEQVESAGAWLIARDAWTAVMDKSADLSAVQRAAHAAIQGNDANGALTIIEYGVLNRGSSKPGK